MKRLCKVLCVLAMLVYAMAVPAQAGSMAEVESNDTADTATPISVNTSVQGSITERYDYDWFAFELAYDGVIYISLSHPVIASTDYYWEFNLYDELGITRYDTFDVIGTKDCVGESIGLPAGKYRVQVEGYNPNGNLKNGSYDHRFSTETYTLRVNYTKSSLWEKELNGSADTATPISVNTNYNGSIMARYDYDWYSFELASAGVVNIDLSHPVIASNDYYWDYYLYDELGLVCYDDFSSVGKTGANGEAIGLPAGKYRVKVTGYNPNENLKNGSYDHRFSSETYTLCVNYTKSSLWEKELNDSADTATPVSLNTNYNGSIMARYDYDWYSFELPVDGVISIDLSHPVIASNDYYWDYYLYDELGLVCYDSSSSIGKSGANGESIGLPAGKYCVRVTGYNPNGNLKNGSYDYRFSSETYTIRVNYTKSDLWEKELNDSADVSTPIQVNTGFNGSIMERYDYDWYLFEITEDRTVTIELKHPTIATTAYYWEVYLYDELGLEQYYIYFVKGNEDFSAEIALAKGKYCVRVTGYNPNGNLKNGSYDYRISDTTYTLNVKASGLPVTLDFDPNSTATGAPAAITAKVDTVVTIPSSTLSRTGYYMLGWSTDKAATVAQYVAGNKLTLDSNKVLYAVWQSAFTTQPKSITVKAGETAAFSVVAKGTGTLKYQWQAYNPNTKTWTNSSSASAKTANFSITALGAHNNFKFRCVVTDGKGNKAFSNAVTLTVNPGIAKQPANTSVTVGSTASFVIEAKGYGTLKYQWQAYNPRTQTWTNSSSSSAKTANLTLTAQAAHNGFKFRCIVTDGNGKTITSSAATLTVKPAITTQPKAKTVPVGGTAEFTIAAKGAGSLKYQWQAYNPNTKQWVNSSSASAKTSTLSITAQTGHHGFKFRCVVTDSNGSSTTSSAVQLTVRPGIVTQPKDVTVSTGGTVKLTVSAKSVGTLSYQWQVWDTATESWKNSLAASAKTANFTFTAQKGHNGKKFRCVLTDSNGNQTVTRGALVTMK